MALSVRSDAVPLEPNQLREFVAELRIQGYFQVAAIALLVYDAIITLDKEIKYFWKLPRRPVDFIYFIVSNVLHEAILILKELKNRYIGIFGAVATLFLVSFSASLPLCNISRWTHDTADWITIMSIDYILMIRILALYSQDKVLSILLKTLLALEAAFKLGMVIYSDILMHNVIGIFANISICGVMTLPPWRLGVIDWLIPSVYGTLLMILALYKVAGYWRMSSDFKVSALVKVLIEDQILYFLLAITCSVFSILELKLQFSDHILAGILTQLGNPAFLSLLGSRMLFNLKDAGERGLHEGTNYRTPSRTMSSMGFAEPVNPQGEGETQHSGSEQME